jgi:uncharacterized PurR-regulated membrane protein YhhQ (DUF165 family)
MAILVFVRRNYISHYGKEVAMFLVHFGLVATIFALIMAPRVFAIHFDNSDAKTEEYDYR